MLDGWPAAQEWPDLLRAPRTWTEPAGRSGTTAADRPCRPDPRYGRKQPGGGVRAALITPVHGRHAHLRAQRQAIGRLDPGPAVRVVVAMDDPEVGRVVGGTATVVTMPQIRGGCSWPRPGTPVRTPRWPPVRSYWCSSTWTACPAPGCCTTTRSRPGRGRRRCCRRPCGYLPPPPPGGYDLDRLAVHPFHAARPAPPPGVLVPDGDHGCSGRCPSRSRRTAGPGSAVSAPGAGGRPGPPSAVTAKDSDQNSRWSPPVTMTPGCGAGRAGWKGYAASRPRSYRRAVGAAGAPQVRRAGPPAPSRAAVA